MRSGNAPKREGYFRRTGRGYPDLSAYGSRFRTAVGGSFRSVSGTSASTPVVAAMVTLWNDRRLLAGKAPLGFLNPLLYAIAERNASAFTDVVIGNNADSSDGSYTCDESFRAAVACWIWTRVWR
jgi:tripeptidyl-peptidase-1